MKALSLWQPHALAIGLGLKPWETRDWPTWYRGPLVIHAAKRPWSDRGLWHDLALMQLRKKLFPSVGDVERPAALCLINPWLWFGALVCRVDVVDCVRTSELRGKIPASEEFWGDFGDGEKGNGRFAFRLENVRMFARPRECRGMQGFFEVALDGEVAAPTPPAEMQGCLFGGA